MRDGHVQLLLPAPPAQIIPSNKERITERIESRRQMCNFKKKPSDRNRNDVLIDVTVASSEKKNSTLQSRRTRKLDSRFSSKDT